MGCNCGKKAAAKALAATSGDIGAADRFVVVTADGEHRTFASYAAANEFRGLYGGTIKPA